MAKIQRARQGKEFVRYQETTSSNPLATILTFAAIAFVSTAQAYAQPRTAKPSTTPSKAAALPGFASSKTSSSWLQNFSSIDQIAVPTGWYAAPLWTGPGCISQRLKPAKDMKRVVDYFIRQYKVVGGKPTAKEIKARQEILKKEDHALTQSEKDSLPELLSAYNFKSAQPLKIEKCQTLNLHGRRAIFIEGSAPPDEEEMMDEGEKSYAYFVDASLDGTTIIELCYRAQPDEYDKYLPLAIKSMNSVRWK